MSQSERAKLKWERCGIEDVSPWVQGVRVQPYTRSCSSSPSASASPQTASHSPNSPWLTLRLTHTLTLTSVHSHTHTPLKPDYFLDPMTRILTNSHVNTHTLHLMSAACPCALLRSTQNTNTHTQPHNATINAVLDLLQKNHTPHLAWVYV